MAVSIKSLGIDQLSFEEQLSSTEELWDGIAFDSAVFPMTDGQRAELDRRISEHEAHTETDIALAKEPAVRFTLTFRPVARHKLEAAALWYE